MSALKATGSSTEQIKPRACGSCKTGTSLNGSSTRRASSTETPNGRVPGCARAGFHAPRSTKVRLRMAPGMRKRGCSRKTGSRYAKDSRSHAAGERTWSIGQPNGTKFPSCDPGYMQPKWKISSEPDQRRSQ
eukprot:scaffold167698_cov31-Tisochrysis_lutea.AAC.4